jgi:regulator of protease activity HflC (stomatin/prohibitin superfamily)
MESAFAWIGAIVEWVGEFIPRRVIIDPTVRGIKFVGGKKVVVLEEGVHWYWPFWTRFAQHPIRRQAVDLRSQTLMTKDGKTIVVGGMVVYEVRDVEALFVQTYDTDQTVKDIALTAIHDTLAQMSWADIRKEQEHSVLNRLLREAVRKELNRYGVRVLKVSLTDLAPTRVIRLVQSQATDG